MIDRDIKAGMTVVATRTLEDIEKGKRYKVMKYYLPNVWELRELGFKGWLNYHLGWKTIIVFNYCFKPEKTKK